MSFQLVIMCNLTSALWCCYGLINEDKFILITNIIGGIVSFLSLSLFALLPSHVGRDTQKVDV